MGKWETGFVSIAGRRASNEDAVLLLPLGEKGIFMAVADGMGGVTGGKVASTIVLEAAREYLLERSSSPLLTSQMKGVLRELCARADAALKKEQNSRPHLAGMGTTLTCVLALGKRFVVANIGDSRVFHLTSRRFDQLTVDHTYIQDMITKTGVRPDPALLRRFAHILTRSIQGNGDSPDIFPKRKRWYSLAEGDGFLLCSDGLILDKTADPDPVLERQMREASGLEECAERMAAAAVSAGSGDNVSVILARWVSPTEEGTATTEGSDEPAGTAREVPEAEGEVIPRRALLLTIALFIVSALAIAFTLHACGSADDGGNPSAHLWSSR